MIYVEVEHPTLEEETYVVTLCKRHVDYRWAMFLKLDAFIISLTW
jgi:hypothetical protein